MNAIPKLLAATLLAFGLLGAPQPAIAESDGWGQGDAEAMLHTYPPGLNTFTRLDQTGLPGLDIRPFQEFYGDMRYCVDDWHVVALAWFDGAFAAEDQGVTYTLADVVAFLEASDAEFLFDGASMDVMRTPIKPVLNEEFRAIFAAFVHENFGPEATIGPLRGLQWGRVLAPADLAVGDHTLRVVVTLAPEGSVIFDQTVRFTVSPSDSPGCALWLGDLG